MIQDSGERRTFESGAVRDMGENGQKGRCDLLPLDVISEFLSGDEILDNINSFQRTGITVFLYKAIEEFAEKFDDKFTMLLEVAKHFEEGANKYTDRNWEKGIPTHCYIDSGVRHYLKFLRGDDDERHDRAFVWNLLCCIWTMKHKPELVEYPIKEDVKWTDAEFKAETVLDADSYEKLKRTFFGSSRCYTTTEENKNDTLDGCNR